MDGPRNPRWSYTRVRGAFHNLDHETGRNTIKRILRESGFDSARFRRTRVRRALESPLGQDFQNVSGGGRVGLLVRDGFSRSWSYFYMTNGRCSLYQPTLRAWLCGGEWLEVRAVRSAVQLCYGGSVTIVTRGPRHES